MNLFAGTAGKKQTLIDLLYFWGFWIALTGLLIGITEQTVTQALKAVTAFIIPHILPVLIISLLFDFLFMKKRVFLFFVIAIPLCYGFGMLINSWFSWVMKGVNIQVNNEVLIYLFAVMYIGFRYIRLAIAQQMLLKEEENKRVTAELHYLRSQLNPHFLFNALNSIYSLILSQSGKAGEATLALSELMRFHIDLSGRQFISLEDEIAMIERYIALEKLKLENRCDIKFKIEGDPQHISIAPLIFMPFVENAFKHGITSVPQANFVHVSIAISEKQVELEISNSVPAKHPVKKTESRIGIDNTIKRLELHYGENYFFNASEKDGRYSVNLKINPQKYGA